MKNISIWADLKNKNVCSRLDKDLNVDVLIIGGGITGISCAYHLINSKLNICLVEKNTIASVPVILIKPFFQVNLFTRKYL